MKTTPSLAELETSGLEELAGLAPELALSEVVPMMNRLVANPAFLDNYILPLIDDARSTEGWYVAHRYELGEGSCSLEVFVWPPGSGTAIHDHSSWGAYRCVLGSLMEERYKRLDDGTQPEYARLKKVWKLWWGPKDGVSTVLPYDGGIHRVGNPGQGTAISVHLYGPRIGEIDGRDYDPARDFVCDRVAA
jgi:predicted metal-dependent enzyme (double-stranded beta helix superfamily)